MSEVRKTYRNGKEDGNIHTTRRRDGSTEVVKQVKRGPGIFETVETKIKYPDGTESTTRKGR